jgi:hypothetical protein
MRARRALGRILLAFALFAPASERVAAHDRFTDPVLAELDDYLMAIQILRLSDGRAADLFARWQAVREASWKIRDLTDKDGLSIHDPAVERQIAAAREMRTRLRDDCRVYFASLEGQLPTARFRIGSDVRVTWSDAVLEAHAGDRDVILIKVTNVTASSVHVEMGRLDERPSDRILFWNKTFPVEPSETRYTFAYLAFTEAGPATSTVALRAEPGIARMEIRANGLPTPGTRALRLLPLSNSRVALPDATRVGGAGGPGAAGAAFPSASIRFRIRDGASGEPLPARVEVTDAQGAFHWTPLRGPTHPITRENVGWRTPLWEFQPGPYFYVDGEGELGVEPAGKTAGVHHGFEYRPVEVKVPADGVVDVALERWIDMPALGWYSGQTHIHTTDAGMPVQFSALWPVVSRAEDLGVSYILTLKGEWDTHAVYSDEFPPGPVSSASTPRHLIAYGQEYRNNPYGHLALLDLDELVEPISSGALGELAGPDYPPNAFVLDAALALGATTVAAHFGNYMTAGNAVHTRWPSTGFEMPADVALGKVQLAEVYGNGGQREIWYKLLNCGFELAATAGPDWAIKDTPRSYVYLGDAPFTLESWTEALRRGESFVTQGPMLFFEVDGARPGARLHYPGLPQRVHVEARALTPRGSQPVEVVVDGQVVAAGADISQDIVLERSAWIAARTEGAHTSPVYVTLQGRPRGSAGNAQEFIAVTDRLLAWVEEKGLFDSAEQREAVINVLREGRRVFARIADQGTR